MNLTGFRANHDFSQWSLSNEGIPVERSDNTGMAMLFERLCARARGASSAATEERKSIGGPARGKIVLERENRQIHYIQ